MEMIVHIGGAGDLHEPRRSEIGERRMGGIEILDIGHGRGSLVRGGGGDHDDLSPMVLGLALMKSVGAGILFPGLSPVQSMFSKG